MDHEDDKRVIALHRKKYGPPDAGGWLPQSMRKGSDRLAFFWIGYAVIALVLLVVLVM